MSNRLLYLVCILLTINSCNIIYSNKYNKSIEIKNLNRLKTYTNSLSVSGVYDDKIVFNTRPYLYKYYKNCNNKTSVLNCFIQELGSLNAEFNLISLVGLITDSIYKKIPNYIDPSFKKIKTKMLSIDMKTLNVIDLGIFDNLEEIHITKSFNEVNDMFKLKPSELFSKIPNSIRVIYISSGLCNEIPDNIISFKKLRYISMASDTINYISKNVYLLDSISYLDFVESYIDVRKDEMYNEFRANKNYKIVINSTNNIK